MCILGIPGLGQVSEGTSESKLVDTCPVEITHGNARAGQPKSLRGTGRDERRSDMRVDWD
jgi:hypothetical protein